MGAGLIRFLARRWRRALSLAVAMTAGLAVAGAQAGAVPVKVRFGGDASSTRIVLDVAQQVDGRVVSTDVPHQIVLEFPHLSVEADSGQGQGLIKDWSLAKAGSGARLTLNLAADGQLDRRFSLAPSDGVDFYRYVVDLKGSGPAAVRTAPQAAPSAAPPAPVIAPTTQVTAPRATPAVSRRNSAKKVIVIDAGHGGHDSGALGAHYQEKQLTLAAAKALKTQLEKTGRYKVVLTRSDDTFIPLEERVRISRAAHADLFISLHADSGGDASVRGASIYTLSDQGSDRVAKNASTNSDWGIDAGAANNNKAVREILFDLTQRFTRNKSAAFAEIMVQNVGAERPLLTRAHRDAGYVVLFAPDVPAVLLEMGFVTNPSDEAMLANSRQRDALAGAIDKSIDNYFSPQVVTASL